MSLHKIAWENREYFSNNVKNYYAKKKTSKNNEPVFFWQRIFGIYFSKEFILSEIEKVMNEEGGIAPFTNITQHVKLN